MDVKEAINTTMFAVSYAFQTGDAAAYMIERHGINMKASDGLIILNYDERRVNWSEPYGHVCRGLILREDDLSVVAFGLTKFFNAGESHAAEISWGQGSVEIYEKLDGTMVQRFWNNITSKFEYSTRFQLPSDLRSNFVVHPGASREGDKTEARPGITWQTLIDRAVGDRFDHTNIQRAWQDPRETWVFELCTRENKIVVDYPEPRLVLLARRRKDTLEELALDHDEFIGEGWRDRPRVWSFDHPDKLAKFLDEAGGPALEGVVLVQKAHPEKDPLKDVPLGAIKRIKIKAKRYVDLHRLRGGLTSFGALVQMALSGDHEELTAYFPEYKPVLDRLLQEWNGLIFRHECAYSSILTYEEIKGIEPEHVPPTVPRLRLTQKKFAEQVNKEWNDLPGGRGHLEFTSALFKVRAGKCGSIREAFLQARDGAKEDLLKAKVGDVTALLPKGGFE